MVYTQTQLGYAHFNVLSAHTYALVARSTDLAQHAGLPCLVGSMEEGLHGGLQSLEGENPDCNWRHPLGGHDRHRSQGHHLPQGSTATETPQEVA